MVLGTQPGALCMVGRLASILPTDPRQQPEFVDCMNVGWCISTRGLWGLPLEFKLGQQDFRELGSKELGLLILTQTFD